VDNVLATVLFFIAVLVLVGLAMWERARQVSAQGKTLNGTARPSPFTNALAYLVGVAGGIYLSLSLVVDFLGAKVPAQVNIWGLEIDPLAAAAILLAVLQPFLLRLYWYVRRFTGGFSAR
jgi:hypothetical protein